MLIPESKLSKVSLCPIVKISQIFVEKRFEEEIAI